MVNRIYLSPEDRQTMAIILRVGLGEQKDQWRPARLALARSLQMPDEPNADLFKVLPHQGDLGVELHAAQFTGEGKGDVLDHTDTYRVLLSMYHRRDLTSDDTGFHDLLQRHIRRGLKHFRETWDPQTDFADYLLRELYSDVQAREGGSEVTGSDLAPRVERILGQLGVGATLIATDDGPRLSRYTLELHGLDDLDRLRRGLTKIAFALGYGESAVTSSLAPGERRVYLSVPRPMDSWRIVTWREISPALESGPARAMGLAICLGTDAMGVPLVLDLADAPHLFVGGTTGSGKSMCLHSILLSLLSTELPPELVLIDPKAVEFTTYERSRHLRGGVVVTSPDAALVTLGGLVQEMEARQERLRALDARNIDEANENGAHLRRIVVVIDELGDLFLTQREVEVPLVRLAQKARSSGIHLVLATQRPEAATFPGLLRSNIPSRIALTVQKAAESRIILDEQGAESLQGRGDMLVRFAGRSTVRAHGCRVDPADILSILDRS